jgi:predicted small secreted protein
MRVIFLISLFLISLSLSSCSTIAGIGDDLQSGGRALKDAAR